MNSLECRYDQMDVQGRVGDHTECAAKLFLSELIIHLAEFETWFVDLRSLYLFFTISGLPRWKWPYINEVHFVSESSPVQIHCFWLLDEYGQVVEHACLTVVL
jgi:hypothetical protein